MNDKTTLVIPVRLIDVFYKSLEEESDRGKVLVAVNWFDFFLRCKLQNEFSKGNKTARKRLFSPGGPFSGFASKLDIAFCAGWISSDLYDDLCVIRGIRNKCAHHLEFAGLNDKVVSGSIAKLKTPSRQFYDWGDLKAAATTNGAVVIYSGERPQDATEDLDFTIPGKIGFRMAIPIVLAVLVCELELIFLLDDGETFARMELRDYMKEAQ